MSEETEAETEEITEENAETLEDLHKILQKQITGNQELERALHVAGMPPNPIIYMAIRLNFLLDRIFGEDEAGRVRFEIETAKITNRVLMEMNQRALREKITSGVVPGGKLR